MEYRAATKKVHSFFRGPQTSDNRQGDIRPLTLPVYSMEAFQRQYVLGLWPVRGTESLLPRTQTAISPIRNQYRVVGGGGGFKIYSPVFLMPPEIAAQNTGWRTIQLLLE